MLGRVSPFASPDAGEGELPNGIAAKGVKAVLFRIVILAELRCADGLAGIERRWRAWSNW